MLSFCSIDFCKDWSLVRQGLNVQIIMTVLKTWTNAWCTSSRYHEEVRLPGVFGCQECDNRHTPDNQKHRAI